MLASDGLWVEIELLIPPEPKSSTSGGCPQGTNPQAFTGIVFKLKTDAVTSDFGRKGQRQHLSASTRPANRWTGWPKSPHLRLNPAGQIPVDR